MMHAFLHGVLMHVVVVIMSPLNPSEKYHLDTIVDEIVVLVRSSMKYGIINLMKGLVLLLLLLLLLHQDLVQIH